MEEVPAAIRAGPGIAGEGNGSSAAHGRGAFDTRLAQMAGPTDSVHSARKIADRQFASGNNLWKTGIRAPRSADGIGSFARGPLPWPMSATVGCAVVAVGHAAGAGGAAYRRASGGRKV